MKGHSKRSKPNDPPTNQDQMYIVLDWQEQGPMEPNGQRLWQQERRICTPDDYPEKLPCHNPRCEGGGFEIGNRIAAFINSDKESEQNSLICNNAIHHGQKERCLHTILYSITRVLPYQRER